MPILIMVPDASVILKWALPPDGEPEADLARMLRNAIVEQEIQALVPALWLLRSRQHADSSFSR